MTNEETFALKLRVATYKLPEYKGNIAAKLHALQPQRGSTFSKVFDTVDELKKELPGGTPSDPSITQESGKPACRFAQRLLKSRCVV